MEAVVRDAARQGCDVVVFPELVPNSWDGCPDCRSLGDAANCEWHLAQAEPVPGLATEPIAALTGELGVQVVFQARGARRR